MEEKWTEIPSYEGLYKFSNSGLIKSLDKFDSIGRFVKGKKLNPSKDSKGYLQIRLSNFSGSKMFLIHRLVAHCFLGYDMKNKLMIVDHINNNPLDNRDVNLQIITKRKNSSKDQFRHNRSSLYIGVTWNKRDCKWKSQIRIGKKLKYLGQFYNEIDASNAYQNKLKEIEL